MRRTSQKGKAQMNVHKIFLKTANSIISFVIIICLLVVAAYALYALWDNHRIYSSAGDVQADLLEMKPDADRPSFDELYAINKDVCAWVTLDNTNIDYPVVQGEDNVEYLNKDFYGNFALAGSIFLDSRCNKKFRDAYSLLYGHHMTNQKMFGDLDLFKDRAFFENNKTGLLMTFDGTYNLEIFASILVPAASEYIFSPELYHGNVDKLLDYTEKEAIHFRKETADKIRKTSKPQVVALTTCSSDFTDARMVVLAKMTPR